MSEEWRKVQIDGYKDFYMISSMGQVKSSISGNILKQDTTARGYKRIELCVKNKKLRVLVHRLVAYSFLTNYENKNQINHKNGVTCDNRVENLEWCTASENSTHCYRVLGRVHPRGNAGKSGSKSWKSKKVIQMSRDGGFIKEWDGVAEAGRVLSIRASCIGKAARGEMPTYKTFKWKYK